MFLNEVKSMNTGNINNGLRINCNGVYGTVIAKRSTRNRGLVLVKMENGFTLKLDTNTLSKPPPAAPATPMSTSSGHQPLAVRPAQ